MGVKSIAIIGGGFSGSAMAMQLARRLPEWQILLIERSGEFGRGTAYADTGMGHLLNVCAANMSAFSEDPGHFERWLRGTEEGAAVLHSEAGQFATRSLYGRYLEETLRDAQRAGRGVIRLLRDEVVGVVRADGGGWQLECASDARIDAQAVVLATGNSTMARPPDGVIHRNPWSPGALDGLKPTQPVLIVGTGLTMADLALALQARGFAAPIIAVSRHGLLPQSHAPVPTPWPTPSFTAMDRATVAGLWRATRAQVAAAEARGVGWRAVIDSLRPITSKLWQGLPAGEQSRFLRHARAYWDAARHRMAVPAAARLQGMRERGALRLIRGRVQHIETDASSARVQILRNGGLRETLAVQRVVYATGLHGLHGLRTGLFAQLVEKGLAQLDAHGLGLRVDPVFSVLDAAGRPHSDLWALGPPVRGMFWECIAVPDIRMQAEALASEIAGRLHPDKPAGAAFPRDAGIRRQGL